MAMRFREDRLRELLRAKQPPWTLGQLHVQARRFRPTLAWRTLSEIANGKRQPTIEVVSALAAALDVEAGYLLDLPDEAAGEQLEIITPPWPARVTAAQEQADGPLCAELAAIAERLADLAAQLGRLVDLYVAGRLDRALLDERQARLEEQRQTLVQRQSDLQAELAALNAPARAIADFAPLAEQMRARWPAAEADYAFRLWVVEQLDVTGRLCVEGDEKVIRARCVLTAGNAERLFVSTTSKSTEQKRHALTARLPLPAQTPPPIAP